MNHHVLFPIIKRLEENNILYSLGGSGLLYYLGLVDSVNDWDLTVECTKDNLIKAIDGYDWVEHRSGDFPFASLFRIGIDSLNVDFIGHFALHTENGILKLPIDIFDEWDDINISSPEIWYMAYYLMNRKLKAQLLLNYLKKETSRVNVNVINHLIQTNGLNDEIKEELRMLIR